MSLSSPVATTGATMARDPEARTLVLQSAALEARAEVLLGHLVEHTRWLQSVVFRMSEDEPDDNDRSRASESTSPEPKDPT